jgi:hypothetical protein
MRFNLPDESFSGYAMFWGRIATVGFHWHCFGREKLLAFFFLGCKGHYKHKS